MSRDRCRPPSTKITISEMASSWHTRVHTSESQSAVTETTWEPLPPVVGQIDSAVRPGRTFTVRLPANLIPRFPTVSGRYFLVRCSSSVGIEKCGDWSVLLRCPLFVCGRQAVDQSDLWQFFLPVGSNGKGSHPDSSAVASQCAADAGSAWLAKRASGDLLNLHGPFGNGFTLQPELQNLLLLVDIENDSASFWKLLPLCEQALDKGGRVTVLIRARSEESVAGLVPFLPVQVEVRTTLAERQWLKQIGSTAGWADQVCAGVPPESYSQLLTIFRNTRFRVDKNFAQILVNADLLCGVGACLVCTVPKSRGGFTRACVHGPVFDLTDLAE